MAVYLRYDPEDHSATNGFRYTINLSDGSWQPSIPRDMSLYNKDDIEHVGWYYIPVEAGVPMWMAPYFNADLGVNMISYIIPYYYGDHTVGIIGMDISLDLLKEAAAGVRVYKSGCAFMMETDGNIIYHKDYPDGISFDKLSDEEQEYFRNIPDMGIDTVSVIKNRRGEDEKVVLKILKNGMILGIYAPLNEINKPQEVLLTQQLTVSFIILILAVLSGLIFIRSITKPLKKMTAVAEQYALGNFEEEISIQGNDEVGILSHSLQTMSTSLKKQIEIADRANRAKSEFLASMSHEIRTPINAVLGMNEMIMREAKQDEILDYSHNIEDSGRNLLSLINTILDFSKIEDGKMEIIPVSYDLASLVNSLVNSVSERAKAKGLSLAVNVDETLPCMLMGDDMRVSQVIMNLLTNAVKYTKTGGITFSVRNGGRKDNTVTLDVSVKDTGIGIKEEDLQKLGVAFERLEEKRNKNIEGTGLGISIVTRLLAMMGSELKIESIYGKGSTFSFSLVQQIDDERPIGDYEERVRLNSRHSPDELPQIKNAKILVVDDFAMNLKVAEHLLKLFGIKPDLVTSGQEAVQAISKKTYHIVFLDHMMPGMDGIETLGVLREKQMIGHYTKMVALTANAVVGAKDLYLSSGFDDYLSKPIEVKALENILVKYLPKDYISYKSEQDKEPEPAPIYNGNAGLTSETLDNGSVVLEFAPRKKSGAKQSDPKLPVEEALREKAGLNVQDGIGYCGGHLSLYIDILADYVHSYTAKSAELEKHLRNNDAENYRIVIHALKSSSKTIGSAELFTKAKELEDASKNGDLAFVTANHGQFAEMYRNAVNNIQTVLKEYNM